MTTAKKPAARKTTARKTTARRTAAPKTRRTTTRRTTTGSARRRRTTRRKSPALATTVGSAIGTLAVTSLLGLSWPARIGLAVVVLAIALGYLVWHNRAEIRAEAQGPVSSPEPAAPSAPTPTQDPERPA